MMLPVSSYSDGGGGRNTSYIHESGPDGSHRSAGVLEKTLRKSGGCLMAHLHTVAAYTGRGTARRSLHMLPYIFLIFPLLFPSRHAPANGP